MSDRYDALHREVDYLIATAKNDHASRGTLRGPRPAVDVRDLEEAVRRAEAYDTADDLQPIPEPPASAHPIVVDQHLGSVGSCFFGHGYGKWTDPVERWSGPPINSALGRREVIRVQERSCSRCGIVDQRVLH